MLLSDRIAPAGRQGRTIFLLWLYVCRPFYSYPLDEQFLPN